MEDSGINRKGKPCVHKIYGTDVSINSACFGYFRSFEIFLQKICEIKPSLSVHKGELLDCYLRFMRLAHIGNGLDIIWRKKMDIKEEISFDQYYEMIEYKTSEILVFMIDCLCILHDVMIIRFLQDKESV